MKVKAVDKETGECVMEFTPFFRTAYNYDRRGASVVSGLKCLEPTLTQQNQREEADINEIVRRFGITGQLPVSIRAPVFGDFGDVFDFQSAQNAIVEARQSFEALPAKVRERFNNDPQKLVEFCSDESNKVEMEKLGLLVKPPVDGGGLGKDAQAESPKVA